MSRRIRWSVPLIAIVAALALSTNALAAVTIGAQSAAGGVHSFNYGTSMEKSTCSGTTYVNAAFASDDGAMDGGPYQSVYSARAPITGNPLSFATPVLASPAATQAERPAIAASGKNVYVVSVSQTSYDTYDPAAERDLYVAKSTNCGSSFGTPVQITTGTTRVDYPIISAAGGNVYIAYTDANAATDNIKVITSNDSGATYGSPVTVGTTAQNDTDGYWGYPSIAASGTGGTKDNLVVGWFSTAKGKMQAATSTNSGGTWSSPVTLANSGYNDGTHYVVASGQDDGAANRVAVTFTTKTDVETRIYTGTGALGAAKVLFTFGTTVAGNKIGDSYGAMAEPFGANGFAAAFAGCYDQTTATPSIALKKSCTSGKAKADLLYVESQNGTALGTVKQIVVSGGSHVVNSAASIVSTGSGAGQRRAILYNSAKKANYQVFAKVVTGSGP